MEHLPFKTHSSRTLALLAVAGIALAGGCGSQKDQGTSSSSGASETPGTAQPEKTQAEAAEESPPATQQTPDEPAPEPEIQPDPEPEAEPQTPPQGEPEARPQPEAAGEGQPAEPAASEGFAELGITDIEVGDGATAEAQDTVTLHYRGTFRESGEEFDSSYSRGEPTTLPLGRFVTGFRQGVEGMQVGGKRRIEIPWRLAYGERGSPPTIPPRSDLVFEVELVGVTKPQQLSTEFAGEPVEMDDGLVVRTVSEGQGTGQVRAGATVFAHILGVVAESGKQFAATRDAGAPQQLDLSDPRMLAGLVRGIEGMKAGETRRIEVPAALGFGESGNPPAIPANADLVFEIEVLSFKNPRELSSEWVREETRENGLVVRVVKEGDPDAEPMPEDAIAIVHTMGTLEDGTKFESTFDRGQPMTTPMEQAAIAGWKQGAIGMRPGEIRQLVIPPELAFGEEGQMPIIPSNATLVFEIELIDWREPRLISIDFVGEEQVLDEGITYRDVKIGEGPEAEAGRIAVIQYMAQLPDGNVVVNTFDTGDIQGVPLDGAEPLPGLRRAIVGMKQGGIRRIELSADQAFGAEGNPPLVPADTPMVFEVELMGVQ